MSFQIIFTSLISILLLALPAFILKKVKLLSEDSIPPLSNLLLYVTNPILSFCNIVAVEKSETLTENMLTMFALSFLAMTVLSLAAILARKLLVKNLATDELGTRKKNRRSVTLTCFAFANIGFMGIPFLQSLYPNEPLPIIYCSIFIATFNIFMWTVGVYLITGDRSFISPKNAFLNPSSVSLIVSVAFYALGARIDLFAPTLFSSLKLLGNATTPLAMSVLGVKLAGISIKDLFLDKDAYIASALRLIVAPLLIYALLLLFPNVDKTVRTITYLVLTMPTATTIFIFSEKFGSDGRFAAAVFLLSTLLSVVTVPVLLLLL